MSGWTILYCVILFVIFLISLGLITQASTKIGASNADPNLQQAYKITTIIAVVLWFAIAASIVGAAAFIFSGGGEAIEAESLVAQYQNNGSIWSTLLFIFFMLLLIIVGVGAAASAVDISRFTGYQNNQDVLKAFDNCCYAAGLCLGTLLIIIGIFIIRFFYTDTPTTTPTTTIAAPAVTPTVTSAGAASINTKNIKTIIAEEAVKQVVK